MGAVLALALLATTEAGALLLLRALLLGARAIAAQPAADTQAIVVLGGTTDRVRTGALVHFGTGLPLLVSGRGTGDSGFAAESEKMADILAREYGIRPRWVETVSMNTAENARFSWCILAPNGVRRVAVVTDPSHLMRATVEFSAVGFQVTPIASVHVAQRQAALHAGGLVPGGDGFRQALPLLKEWAALASAVFRRITANGTRCDAPTVPA